MVEEGKITPKEEITPISLPLDMPEAQKQKLIRKQTRFTTTISSDLGEEMAYGSIPVTEIIKDNYSLGEVLGLLWFKKKLPPYFTQFLEKCILLTADHVPRSFRGA